jgi:hypothetical protein
MISVGHQVAPAVGTAVQNLIAFVLLWWPVIDRTAPGFRCQWEDCDSQPDCDSLWVIGRRGEVAHRRIAILLASATPIPAPSLGLLWPPMSTKLAQLRGL